MVDGINACECNVIDSVVFSIDFHWTLSTSCSTSRLRMQLMQPGLYLLHYVLVVVLQTCVIDV